MSKPRPRRRGPRRLREYGGPRRVVSFCLWPDTLEALDKFAAREGLYRSGAAHQLIRQALGLAPIQPDTDA